MLATGPSPGLKVATNIAVRGSLHRMASLTVACSLVLVVSVVPEASSTSRASTFDSILRSACEHPSAFTSRTVPSNAVLIFARTDIGEYPFGDGAGEALAMFSRGPTLYDCVVSSTHISADMTNVDVMSSTASTAVYIFAGVVGLVRGGYSANRNLETDTAWVTGTLAPGVTHVNLKAYLGACFGPMTCLALGIANAKNAAVIRGRFFLTSLVVTYSKRPRRIGLVVSGVTGPSIRNTGVIAGSFVPPATYVPTTSTFRLDRLPGGAGD